VRGVLEGTVGFPERDERRITDMEDLLVGLVAVTIGSALCFRGYAALRVVIAIWGAFAGFLLGAGVVAGATGEGLLASALAWTVGLVVAVVFGLLAYAYYAISVLIGMSAIGFTLGATAAVALGVTWSWVVVLVGSVVGALLATLAIASDLPRLILALLGAFAGSSIAIGGVLLTIGRLDRGDLASAHTTAALDLWWGWTVAYVVLALAGLASQMGDVGARRGTLRDHWSG
jgi:hypothetical protein